ncbi:putative sugar lactone lactonase YvrE [Belonocnema kinseyi]|uniref:putative sugar lactone lactonase YvrE n=1 Tax=Belonocnema kinseyi TaxID=2817044 RepID=UPI00143CCF24|nr:putative sugar lactone lactonase YvrE [Belonocnema kinseyi]
MAILGYRELGLLSFAVPVEGQAEEFVVGGGNNIILIEWDSSKNRKHPPHIVLDSAIDLPLGNRWGYAGVDHSKKLWIVTTNDNPEIYGENLGMVYRLNKDRKLKKKLVGLNSITGGFAWDHPSPGDIKRGVSYRFYYADPPRKQVALYDFIASNGEKIENRQPLLWLPRHNLNCDPGRIAMDTRGYLWVPLIGGRGVIEYNPMIDRTFRFIDIPAAKVGACVFGGDAMEILFVSTIGYEYKEPHQHRPHADEGGHIYAIRNLGVNGEQLRKYFVNEAKLPQEIIQARARRALPPSPGRRSLIRLLRGAGGSRA